MKNKNRTNLNNNHYFNSCVAEVFDKLKNGKCIEIPTFMLSDILKRIENKKVKFSVNGEPTDKNTVIHCLNCNC